MFTPSMFLDPLNLKSFLRVYESRLRVLTGDWLVSVGSRTVLPALVNSLSFTFLPPSRGALSALLPLSPPCHNLTQRLTNTNKDTKINLHIPCRYKSNFPQEVSPFGLQSLGRHTLLGQTQQKAIIVSLFPSWGSFPTDLPNAPRNQNQWE